MATSVVLRACGGIGPYTWSKTGNVTLSATEGTQITVTASGTAGVSSNFYITFSTCALSCTTGTCATYASNGAFGLCGVPSFSGRTTDCNGNAVGSLGFNNTGLTCGSTVASAADCSGTLTIACTGSCTGAGGSCSASGLSSSITLSCGSNSGTLDHTDWIGSGAHEYLIINGGSGVTGSTVTVTDDAGISVTYTF